MLAQVVFYIWVVLNVILAGYIFLEIILLIYALMAPKTNSKKKLSHYPAVTVQLPVYNDVGLF